MSRRAALASLASCAEEEVPAPRAPVLTTSSVGSTEDPTADTEVWLVEAPRDRRIVIVKVVRETTGLGLRDAVNLVDAAPRLVKSTGDRAEAEAIAKSLRDAGATVEIR